MDIQLRNPSTGKFIGTIPSLDPTELPALFEKASLAQREWALLSPEKRSRFFKVLLDTLIREFDNLVGLISEENGKPSFEAITHDLLPCLETLRYYIKNGKTLLQDQELSLGLFPHRKSLLHFAPLGVTVVISPWNFPFMLPFCQIASLVLCGNAVILKPSEITPRIGEKIQDLFELSGFPTSLVQAAVGGPELGKALIAYPPAKIFFTGSVNTGKKVMAQAAEKLTPVNLELGGKDPMIVMADADLDFATSAALWGGFCNSGQVCASTERILVHESLYTSFIETLKSKTQKLRATADLSDTDLGFITFETQKKTYEQHLKDAQDKKLTFLTGGLFAENHTRLIPTLVVGENVESSLLYKEETFGPTIAITKFRTISEAVEKANSTPYGLLASIITKDISQGKALAKKLEHGSVLINEVAYTAGIPETPWGGIKSSGIGRSHGMQGLLECVNIRHIHMPKASFLTFKSPWWFPYTQNQYALFRSFVELYRTRWFEKAKFFPHFLDKLVRFLKTFRPL